MQQLNDDSQLHSIELRLRNSRIISCDAYLLREQHLAILIAKDISNSKQFLNYIIEFGARKDALLDMLAHNLSGPLNLTNNLLNLVDQINNTQQYKTINSQTRLIRENTQQCIEIINSLLMEEHLASAKVFVESNRFDVVAKSRIVIERIKPFNADKEISLYPDADQIFISLDDVKYFQVVHNLISNAVKYTPPAGKVSVEIIEMEDRVVITVADNGIGIPEHLQPYVFQRNTPAARQGLKGERSIGMGLYIVKKLVELMKGELTFESNENAGTKFVVWLPKMRLR